eukprot:1160107-Pelagomonas_calceolata.AAC.4
MPARNLTQPAGVDPLLHLIWLERKEKKNYKGRENFKTLPTPIKGKERHWLRRNDFRNRAEIEWSRNRVAITNAETGQKADGNAL